MYNICRQCSREYIGEEDPAEDSGLCYICINLEVLDRINKLEKHIVDLLQTNSDLRNRLEKLETNYHENDEYDDYEDRYYPPDFGRWD